MLLVNQLYETILHPVGWLFLFLPILLSSLDEMKIILIPLKEELVSEVYTVFITTNFMESIHVELKIKLGVLVSQMTIVFHV